MFVQLSELVAHPTRYMIVVFTTPLKLIGRVIMAENWNLSYFIREIPTFSHYYFIFITIRYINRSFTILYLDLSRHYQYLVGVCNDHINIEWQLYSLLPYTIFSFLYYSYTIMLHWFMPKALSESKVIVVALHVTSRKFWSFGRWLYNHVFTVKVGWSQSWNMIWFNKWTRICNRVFTRKILQLK